ncbi:hypothetical protein ACU21_07265 [Actinobaculum suis]|nr:hypothetical protein ACU21_07265 [Actinobaculum suis]
MFAHAGGGRAFGWPPAVHRRRRKTGFYDQETRENCGGHEPQFSRVSLERVGKPASTRQTEPRWLGKATVLVSQPNQTGGGLPI